jgi:hypothetical protein
MDARKGERVERPGELQYDVRYPGHLSRLLIFVKWLLVIPHLIILYFMMIALGVVTFIAWWAILFTGRYPQGMWMFSMSVMRWSARVNAYYLLMRDEYPPFGDGDYPVRFDMAPMRRQSRLLLFVRWLALIPHLVVLSVLGFVAGLALFVAWWAILLTGRFPRSLFDFCVGVNRWSNRVMVYWYLLTDRYPPFSLGPDPAPVAPAAGVGPYATGVFR